MSKCSYYLYGRTASFSVIQVGVSSSRQPGYMIRENPTLIRDDPEVFRQLEKAF